MKQPPLTRAAKNAEDVDQALRSVMGVAAFYVMAVPNCLLALAPLERD